jgi:hypothetical protein
LEILDELRSTQIFKEMENDFVLIFSISDCDLPETVIEYNKKFNSKEISNEYEQWLKEENENENENENEEDDE